MCYRILQRLQHPNASSMSVRKPSQLPQGGQENCEEEDCRFHGIQEMGLRQWNQPLDPGVPPARDVRLNRFRTTDYGHAPIKYFLETIKTRKSQKRLIE